MPNIGGPEAKLRQHLHLEISKAPVNIGKQVLNQFRHVNHRNRLAVHKLCVELPGHGYPTPAGNQRRLVATVDPNFQHPSGDALGGP